MSIKKIKGLIYKQSLVEESLHIFLPIFISWYILIFILEDYFPNCLSISKKLSILKIYFLIS